MSPLVTGNGAQKNGESWKQVWMSVQNEGMRPLDWGYSGVASNWSLKPGLGLPNSLCCT